MLPRCTRETWGSGSGSLRFLRVLLSFGHAPAARLTVSTGILKKFLHPLKPVAIMRMATRVSRGTLYELYKLERSTRSMGIESRAADMKKPTATTVGSSRGRTIHVRNRRLDLDFAISNLAYPSYRSQAHLVRLSGFFVTNPETVLPSRRTADAKRRSASIRESHRCHQPQPPWVQKHQPCKIFPAAPVRLHPCRFVSCGQPGRKTSSLR
jgi:hypothetical protein